MQAQFTEAWPALRRHECLSRARRKQKRLPVRGAVSVLRDADAIYCEGSNDCEKPVVFTERSMGVLGGKYCGPSVKLVSKL